ncbi:transcription activator MBF2 domain-containing protein [Phthorimaea operculella]|nr:transcription activator MBF2 domain-containing protein [Phthorimaea operculella]
MKVVLSALVLCVVAVTVYSENGFYFQGSSVNNRLVRKERLKFKSEKAEEWHYVVPGSSAIKGILAFDETNSSAAVNVTRGGISFPYVTLEMKPGKGQKEIKFDVSIYA